MRTKVEIIIWAYTETPFGRRKTLQGDISGFRCQVSIEVLGVRFQVSAQVSAKTLEATESIEDAIYLELKRILDMLWEWLLTTIVDFGSTELIAVGNRSHNQICLRYKLAPVIAIRRSLYLIRPEAHRPAVGLTPET